MTTPFQYRSDIDGLRTIAVVSVVLFHYFPHLLPSGFIGVSIFFVISGYLITSVILTDLALHRFTLRQFYIRRITRIFPMLIITLAATLGLGWFLLFAYEYKDLGRDAIFSSIFLQNFNLIDDLGYFDTDAAKKPLLHLWSIAIEEQFYLAWPAVVLLLARAGALRWLICLVALLALGAGYMVQSATGTAAYFHPIARGWELAAGAMAAGFLQAAGQWPLGQGAKRPADLMAATLIAATGLGLLLAGFALIDKTLPYPLPYAILPVLGTVCLILAGPQNPISRFLLGHNGMASFGKLSYALYLLHWPILSFIHITSPAPPGPGPLVAGIALSVAAAALGYAYIEKPAQRRRNAPGFAVILLGAMAVVAGLGYGIFVSEGAKGRQNAASDLIDSITAPDVLGKCFEIEYGYSKPTQWYCDLGRAEAAPIAFALGDSHALSLYPALSAYADLRGGRILFTGNSGCPPLLGIQSLRGADSIRLYNCLLLNERVFDYVKTKKIPNVILAARWTYYTISKSRPNEFNPIVLADGEEWSETYPSGDPRLVSLDILRDAMQKTVQRYQAIGTQVIFVQDVPQQIYGPKDILRKVPLTEAALNGLSVPKKEHLAHQAEVTDMIGALAPQTLNFDAELCTQDICPLVAQGRFLYSDDDHISVFGAMTLLPSLTAQLDAALRP